ncbi:MAG: hypothetical protein RL217_951 [Pseudomonadota bacterium]|jgi:RND family efflux transporter MFP subunit
MRSHALCRKAVLSVAVFFSVSVFAQEPLPVQVVSAHWQDYAHPVPLSGLLENKSEQNLAFKVGGFVRQTRGFAGQWVKEGEVLATLNLEEIDAQVAKAQSVLDNAERNLERFENLRGKDALSDEQLQAAQTRMDVARSDLTVAKFNQRHAVIRAPADGRVLKRFVEANEMVAPGTPAFLFAPKQSGWVLRANVTDRDIVRLSLNDKAQVSLDTYPGVVFSAQVNELAARAGLTQTFAVELRVTPQEAYPFLAGFVGKAEIIPEKTRKVLLLPTTALVHASRPQAIREVGVQSEVEVFVLKDGKASLRKVPLIALVNGNMVIASGLNEGEQVVTTGAAYLSEGRAAKIVPLVAQ